MSNARSCANAASHHPLLCKKGGEVPRTPVRVVCLAVLGEGTPPTPLISTTVRELSLARLTCSMPVFEGVDTLDDIAWVPKRTSTAGDVVKNIVQARVKIMAATWAARVAVVEVVAVRRRDSCDESE